MRFAAHNGMWIFISIVTSNIGALGRIAYEKETKQVSGGQALRYCTAAWMVGYICLDVLLYVEYPRWIGICSLVGGLISVDLIKLLIEQLPKLLFKRLSKIITGDNKTLNDEI